MLKLSAAAFYLFNCLSDLLKLLSLFTKIEESPAKFLFKWFGEVEYIAVCNKHNIVATDSYNASKRNFFFFWDIMQCVINRVLVP